jgi:hypothetical protein
MTKDFKLITFNAENRPKVISGEKTRFSEVIVPQPNWMEPPTYQGDGVFIAHSPELANESGDVNFIGETAKSPYQVGDIVGIREPYQIDAWNERLLSIEGNYLDDGERFDVCITAEELKKIQARKHPYRRTSGLLMYKSLCRHFKEIVEVRAERLQDISEEDIIAEGVSSDLNLTGDGISTPTTRYVELWDKTATKESYKFNANPFVFAYKFKEIKL